MFHQYVLHNTIFTTVQVSTINVQSSVRGGVRNVVRGSV